MSCQNRRGRPVIGALPPDRLRRVLPETGSIAAAPGRHARAARPTAGGPAHAAPDHARDDLPAARQLQPCRRRCRRRPLAVGLRSARDRAGRHRAGVVVEEQAEACFANLLAILAAAGMGPARSGAHQHLSRPTRTTSPPTWRCATATSAAPPPASTLLVVRALARPQFKIEIEAIAAHRVGRSKRPGSSLAPPMTQRPRTLRGGPPRGAPAIAVLCRAADDGAAARR